MSLYSNTFVSRMYSVTARGILNLFSRLETTGSYGLYGKELDSTESIRQINLFCSPTVSEQHVRDAITMSIHRQINIKTKTMLNDQARKVVRFRVYVHAIRPLILIVYVTFTHKNCPYKYVTQLPKKLQSMDRGAPREDKMPFRIVQHVMETPYIFGGFSFPVFVVGVV